MLIASNLQRIKNELQKGVTLVAVSKTKPNEAIKAAYAEGQRVFGENRPQELKAKADALPQDIEWHMIGHLQSNKVKYIAPYVSLIHSIDKLSLLQEVNKRAIQHQRVIRVLLQIYIAKEDSKFGLNKDELIELVNSEAFQRLKNIQVVGLMGMATNTDSDLLVRGEFAELKQLFDQIKKGEISTRLDLTQFTILSMGMSGDYTIAMEEGSTMVRIGSSIFGLRD